ncbi:MAG: SDR family oxidoreductase [Myxococcales bacterium]|nr:SDR family oxidoreductase [Myxococcales bacterium]
MRSARLRPLRRRGGRRPLRELTGHAPRNRQLGGREPGVLRLRGVDADVVLLTGLPSLLARAVCGELLRADPRANVSAIVRAKSAPEAHAHIAELPADQRRRVRIVEGDAAAIDLGLSGAEWKALAREVTRIHHCAQADYQATDRKTAERVNVGGAREALEFAGACERLDCLVFHSTAHVAGDRRGVVLEAELEAGQTFRSVVEETKARAEKLVRAAMPALPVAVVRPSTIVGHSRSGEVDRFEGPYLLFLLVVTSPPDLSLPLPGGGDEPLNLVPIDWVARAAVAIGRDPRARGRTFHLVDPQPLTARQVFELVARAGGRRAPRGSIPANLAKALLRAPGLDRLAKSPRAFVETLTTRVTYDARNADELLTAVGVEPCPPIETYVDKLVQYLQMRIRERRATKKQAAEVDDPLV